MSDEHPNEPAATMLFAEASRMLEEQRSALETLRTRGIALLSVGAALAAFFGSRLPAPLSTTRHFAVGIAVGAFAASVLAVAAIVAPHDFKFSHRLEDYLATLEEGTIISTYDLAFTWARGYEKMRAFNEKTIGRLMWAFVGTSALMALQVAAWVIAVAR